ncbi:Maf-like protein [Saliniradius amylolyticus]|uniref:dTTP/UTP pyrophosphatase n=1 Tax=Saliniradius amylolyticus TaxID=2183582 RepID=A0A2S2DZG5_9ALTE|nr:Maf family protein [Saliniradius amylolyticus]AWL10798.1 Maf-like protein [Saliniradius amylolyticus]
MLILASRSPRRADFLTQLGVAFQQQAADVDETPLPNELPADYVIRVAELKATTIAAHTEHPVLGSDTAVVIDNDPLGKPENKAHFQSMMERLSGRCHQVMTAVSICVHGQCHSRLVTTSVWVKPLTEQEINWYWDTGEPQDKAGGYGIQGLAGRFIPKIDGSYSAVVGLPLYETNELLRELDIYER